MENISTYQKVKAIRNDTAETCPDINFKKIAFGGFDCKEVLDYIRDLKEKIQLSEKAFNEKIEECSSASNMYLLGRDKLTQQIEEQAEEIKMLKKQLQALDEHEKEALKPYVKENEELRSMIRSLQQQIENDGQSETINNEINELNECNKELSDELLNLMDAKNNLDTQNLVLSNELSKTTKQIDKMNSEIEQLKKESNMLKISKRNLIMTTNMKVFEHKQVSQLGIDHISRSIYDIVNVLSSMKTDLSEFFEKVKIDSTIEDCRD
ncbi:MAG: hypothetical protein N2Z65_04375 [Clostridiales bacterium]|nr:hypothetical protein [Clostridiales bacterium]